jgi:hypothetical protein
MPIPIPLPDADDPGGLPSRFLQLLFAQRRTEMTDPADGSQVHGWQTVTFHGRIARGQSSEVDDLGRQASVTRVKLVTNYDGLRTEDRVLDPEGDDVAAWQLDGDPWPVYAASSVHHYEANLRRVDG